MNAPHPYRTMSDLFASSYDVQAPTTSLFRMWEAYFRGVFDFNIPAHELRLKLKSMIPTATWKQRDAIAATTIALRMTSSPIILDVLRQRQAQLLSQFTTVTAEQLGLI